MTSTRAAAPTDKRPPGRPRSARAEQAIIEAVLEMLGEGIALEALSVESVAARAGVGKATIYRRWSSKEELVVEAVTALKLPLPELAGESVRADLVALVRAAGQDPADGRVGVLDCLLSQLQRCPELAGWYHKAVEPRREAVRQVLRRGVRTGELRADVDLEVTLALLVAPMVLQRMTGWSPAPGCGPDLAERIVDAVLTGAAGE